MTDAGDAPRGRKPRKDPVVTEINVLGPIELKSCGELLPVPPPTSQLWCAALVCLAEQARTKQYVPSTLLINSMWKAETPGGLAVHERAESELETPMSHLWRDFGIPVTGVPYQLDLPSDATDIGRFLTAASKVDKVELLTSDEDLEECRGVLNLWRGDPGHVHHYLWQDLFSGHVKRLMRIADHFFLSLIALDAHGNLDEIRRWQEHLRTVLQDYAPGDRVASVIEETERAAAEKHATSVSLTSPGRPPVDEDALEDGADVRPRSWGEVQALDSQGVKRAFSGLFKASAESSGQHYKEIADLLGVDPSVPSRWVTGREMPSRSNARKIDAMLPLEADFTAESLRDLYLLKADREEGLAGEDDVKLQEIPAALLGTTCAAAGAIAALPLVVEPIDPGERVCYALFPVADPIRADSVAVAFFEKLEGQNDGRNARLLTSDHLMGRWDICLKFVVGEWVSADKVYEELQDALFQEQMFTRTGINPRQGTVTMPGLPGQLVTSESRGRSISDMMAANPGVNVPARLRTPPPGSRDSFRLQRTLFFVDIQHVRAWDDRLRLFRALEDIAAEASAIIEACARGADEIVLELSVPCGGAEALNRFNRRFEVEINSSWIVQKYNLTSYDHRPQPVGTPVAVHGRDG